MKLRLVLSNKPMFFIVPDEMDCSEFGDDVEIEVTAKDQLRYWKLQGQMVELQKELQKKYYEALKRVDEEDERDG